MIGTYTENGKRLMNWRGKLLGGGIGFLIYQAPGALLGIALGHYFDRGGQFTLPPFLRARHQRREAAQERLFEHSFALMGHVAKSKGRVTPADIAAAQAVMARMDLDAGRRKAAIGHFTRGKESNFPLDPTLTRLRDQNLGAGQIRHLMELLLEIAYADGAMQAQEQRLLLRIGGGLGLSRDEFERMEALVRAERRFADPQPEAEDAPKEKAYEAPRRHARAEPPPRHGERRTHRDAPHEAPREPPRRPGFRRAAGGRAHSGRERVQQVPGCSPLQFTGLYAVLGVSASAGDAEIKTAYRRKLSQYHPDKLMAKGLDEAELKRAADKTHEIKQAYEKIRQLRGF